MCVGFFFGGGGRGPMTLQNKFQSFKRWIVLCSLLINIRETNCIIHRREIYWVDSIIHLLSILDAYSKVRYYPLARWEVCPVLGVANPGGLGVGGVTPSLNLWLWFDNYCFQRKWSTVSADLSIFSHLIF